MSNNPFNLFNSFAASFLHEVDDLVAVLALVGTAGNVDPEDATVGGLLDELVVVAMVHDPGEPPVEDVGVGETLALLASEVIEGDADVAGFAKGVLGGIDTSDFEVELWGAVAGADDDGLACEGSEGFKDFFA